MKQLIALILLVLLPYLGITQLNKTPCTCIPDSALRKVAKSNEEGKIAKKEVAVLNSIKDSLIVQLAIKDSSIKILTLDTTIYSSIVQSFNTSLFKQREITELVIAENKKLSQELNRERKPKLGTYLGWVLAIAALLFK